MKPPLPFVALFVACLLAVVGAASGQGRPRLGTSLRRTTLTTDYIETNALNEDLPRIEELSFGKEWKPSSSSRSAGASDDGRREFVVRTGTESEPYAVLDLGDSFFVESISIVGETLSSMRVMVSNDSSYKIYSKELEKDLVGWEADLSLVHHAHNEVDLLVHAPGRFVRLQRTSPGVLAVDDVKVLGSSLRAHPLVASTACFDEESALLCSGHGGCSQSGSCECDLFYKGEKCDALQIELVAYALPFFFCFFFFWYVFERHALHFCWILFGAPPGSTSRRGGAHHHHEPLKIAQLDERDRLLTRLSVFPSSQKTALIQQDDKSSSESAAVEMMPWGRFGTKIKTSATAKKKAEPCRLFRSLYEGRRCKDAALQHQVETQNVRKEDASIVLLFASPLVMVTKRPSEDAANRSLAVSDDDVVFAQQEEYSQHIQPIETLDVEREADLLLQSLHDASLVDKRVPTIQVECATLDSLQAILTVNKTTCLQFSGHCHPEFICLETAAGDAMLVSVKEKLRNILSSAVKGEESRLKLVTLLACHSYYAAVEFVNAAGCPNVVALKPNRRIKDVTAAEFSRSFYLALACGRTVGDAFDIAKESTRRLWEIEDPVDPFLLLPENTSHDEVLFDQAKHKHALVKKPSVISSTSSSIFKSTYLPALGEDFCGRSIDTWQIVDDLVQRKRRVVLISDVPGKVRLGKTELALAVCHHLRLRRSRSCFQDGILFLPRERAETASTLLTALSKSFEPILSADAVQLLASADESYYAKANILANELAMTQPQCLIVVDHVDAVNHDDLLFLLEKILKAATKLQVVLTSRSIESFLHAELGVHVESHVVQPLSKVDATLLFTKLTGDVVDDIVHRTQGAPASIRREAFTYNSSKHRLRDESSAAELMV